MPHLIAAMMLIAGGALLYSLLSRKLKLTNRREPIIK